MTRKRPHDMRTIYGPHPVCMPDPRPGTCAIKVRYRSWADAERFCLAIMAGGEPPQFAYRHGDHWHTTSRDPYARPKEQKGRDEEAPVIEHLVTTLAEVWPSTTGGTA